MGLLRFYWLHPDLRPISLTTLIPIQNGIDIGDIFNPNSYFQCCQLPTEARSDLVAMPGGALKTLYLKKKKKKSHLYPFPIRHQGCKKRGFHVWKKQKMLLYWFRLEGGMGR